LLRFGRAGALLDFENVEHYGLVGDCLAGPQTIDAIVGRPAIKVERTMVNSTTEDVGFEYCTVAKRSQHVTTRPHDDLAKQSHGHMSP